MIAAADHPAVLIPSEVLQTRQPLLCLPTPRNPKRASLKTSPISLAKSPTCSGNPAGSVAGKSTRQNFPELYQVPVIGTHEGQIIRRPPGLFRQRGGLSWVLVRGIRYYSPEPRITRTRMAPERSRHQYPDLFETRVTRPPAWRPATRDGPQGPSHPMARAAKLTRTREAWRQGASRAATTPKATA